MRKIFILTFVDLDNVGYQTNSVEVYNTFDEANSEMKKKYLEKCVSLGIETPMEMQSIDYGFSDDYAYVFGRYYWDIFEKEI